MSSPPAAFYFGAMSPYSWIAAERIDQLMPHADWRAVLAGAVFKAHGRVSWGLTERRAEGMADCEARALARGLGTIAWPDPWPTSDLIVARAMTYADARGELRPFALSAMRLAFREGLDLGRPEAVREAARRTGLDPDAVEQASTEPQVKQELRAVTDEALSLGVFGVPTVVVEGELFWGEDRLEQAAAASARSAGPARS